MESSELDIRQVKAKDFVSGYPDVANLVAPAFVQMGGDESRIASLQSVGQHRYVAVDESGAVVGVATLLVEPKLIHQRAAVGHIEDVAVREDWQGRGVGRRLVAALQQLATERGCYKVVLYCSEDNRAFYEKMGFREHNIAMRWDCG